MGKARECCSCCGQTCTDILYFDFHAHPDLCPIQSVVSLSAADVDDANNDHQDDKENENDHKLLLTSRLLQEIEQF